MSTGVVTTVGQSSWNFDAPNCKDQVACLVIGVVLTALAGVATYFCLLHGLQMIDTASSTLLRFQAGALLYSGVAFSVVAVGNALYTGCKFLCSDKEFEYTTGEAKIQIGISVLAPIAAIPGIIVLALGGALK